MAEGELDVDSLISRLLEGEFPTLFYIRSLVLCGVSPQYSHYVFIDTKGPLWVLALPGSGVSRTGPCGR